MKPAWYLVGIGTHCNACQNVRALFPKALGIVLVAATVCYLVDALVAFLAPEIAKQVSPLLVIGPIVAEVWLLGYLLVKGVRSPRRADHASVTELAPVAG